MKKLKPYIIGLLASLLMEALVFNFSSIVSLVNQPVDMTQYLNHSEESMVRIDDIDIELRSLLIDTPIEPNFPIEYKIWNTDEGNYYEYPLGTGVLSAGAPSSKFINIHGYGNTKSLVFYFEGDNKPDYEALSIVANPRRPLFFNIVRVLVVFAVFCFFYALRNKGELIRIPMAFDQSLHFFRVQKVITILIILLWIGAGYFFSSSHPLFNEVSKPHHQQYKELAQMLMKGQVELDYVPSSELVEAANPYDTIYLQANNIDYRADYAYFKGHYYVYFGIVPELILYLPCQLILGRELPNHLAVFCFYSIFATGIFLFYRELLRKYFDRVSFPCYLIVSSFTVACAPIAYCISIADLYTVPIMAAMAFSVWGLYLWLKGDSISSDRALNKAIVFGLGSLCMALVAGCRPQLLLFGALGIPFLWDTVIKKRELFSKKSMGRTLALLFPYVVIAALVMWYNHIRFGNVFDFGATYSLTSNDMNLRGVSLERMLSGLGIFLFQPPLLDGQYPYLRSVSFNFDYFGRIMSEHFFGGVITCNILIWPLLLLYFYRKEVSLKKLWSIFGILLGASLVIGLVDINSAGILQRYLSEMSFGILIAASIMLFMLVNFASKLSGREFCFVMGFIRIGFILELAYSLLIILNIDAGITLKQYNPDLFYRIGALFRF